MRTTRLQEESKMSYIVIREKTKKKKVVYFGIRDEWCGICLVRWPPVCTWWCGQSIGRCRPDPRPCFSSFTTAIPLAYCRCPLYSCWYQLALLSYIKHRVLEVTLVYYVILRSTSDVYRPVINFFVDHKQRHVLPTCIFASSLYIFLYKYHGNHEFNSKKINKPLF